MTRHDADARQNQTHQRALELLPWYVNGTLDDQEHRAVEVHVTSCSACQAELAKCHDLAEVVRATEDVAWSPAPDRLSRLLSRIDAAEAHHALANRWWGKLHTRGPGEHAWWRRTPPVARWALVAQGVLILLLLSTIVWQSASAPASFYRTLADVGAPAPQDRVWIRIVFADDMTIREMRALLSDIGGMIIKGPSSLGVYTVDVPAASGLPDHMSPILKALRAHQKVRLAEPVTAR